MQMHILAQIKLHSLLTLHLPSFTQSLNLARADTNSREVLQYCRAGIKHLLIFLVSQIIFPYYDGLLCAEEAGTTVTLQRERTIIELLKRYTMRIPMKMMVMGC